MGDGKRKSGKKRAAKPRWKTPTGDPRAALDDKGHMHIVEEVWPHEFEVTATVPDPPMKPIRPATKRRSR